MDLGARDRANTWDFEDMAAHNPRHGPIGGHPIHLNIDHEGHASYLNTNDADYSI